MAEQTENHADEKTSRSLTTRDLMQAFFRHKWKMVFFFLAVMCVVTAATFLSPEIYQSEAKLLLKMGRESVTLDPTATTGPVMHVSQSRESQINSEIEILRGRDLVEKVIDSIGLEEFLKKPDERTVADSKARQFVHRARKAIRSFARLPRNILKQMDIIDELSGHEATILGVTNGLYVGAGKDSSIIKISYEAQSPVLAQKVVARLIDLYLENILPPIESPARTSFFWNRQSY